MKALYIIDPVDNSLFRYEGGRLEAADEITFSGHVVPFTQLVDFLW